MRDKVTVTETDLNGMFQGTAVVEYENIEDWRVTVGKMLGVIAFASAIVIAAILAFATALPSV